MAGDGAQPAAIAITFLFPALSLSVVVVRVWRNIVKRTFATEDAILCVAMALAIAYTFVSYAYIKANYWAVPAGSYDPSTIDTVYVNKLHYAYAIIYNPILCLVKASFLLTLSKLHSPRVWLNRSIIFTQVINAAFMIGATVASICACIPISKNFDESVPGHCYDVTTYVIASVCVVILTDIMVVIMPTWMIYDLHMSWGRKIIIISFLSFGFAVIAIGIIRLEYFVRLFVYGQDRKETIEQTYSTMESNIAIIGACGPTIKWMLGLCIPSLRSTEKRSSSFGHPSSSASNIRQKRYTADPMEGGLVVMGRQDLMHMGNRDSVELRDGTSWKAHSGSVGSDERSETANGDPNRIVKTVEWNIDSGEQAKGGKNEPVDPAFVV